MKPVEIQNHKTFFYHTKLKPFLKDYAKERHIFLLVDANVFEAHKSQLSKYNYFIIPSGEKVKSFSIIQKVLNFLLQQKADRQSCLIGIGGGVTTDIAGFVASIYMRGIRFGFVPTTVLAMVDASLGGKNGINIGAYKNMVGTINQPDFLVYDYSLLKSLPNNHWIDGFAEIIKHAVLFDTRLFYILEKEDLKAFKTHLQLFSNVVERNIALKYKIVKQDTNENDSRRLLNFGHTVAHALERKSKLSHGQAVAIGMHTMSLLSEQLLNFKEVERFKNLLHQYKLPSCPKTTINKEMSKLMYSDKKQTNGIITDTLLQKIAQPTMHSFTMQSYEKNILNILNN